MTGRRSSYHKIASTEVWPKQDSQCTLQDFPLDVLNPVGFWTAQGPVVCGGYNGGGNKCFIYKHRQWMPWTNMTTLRGWASAVQIGQNQALIIGGESRYAYTNTTELVSSGGSEEGNEFPETISRHCSFTINATHGMVTAGLVGNPDGGGYSASTWFVDLTTTRVTPGPPMTKERDAHGCSIFKHGTKSYGIVSGGDDGKGYFAEDSSEMIDFDQESPNWTEGIQDKSKIVYL